MTNSNHASPVALLPRPLPPANWPVIDAWLQRETGGTVPPVCPPRLRLIQGGRS